MTDLCEFEGGPWDGERRHVERGIEILPVVKQQPPKAPDLSPGRPVVERGGMYHAVVDDRGGRRFVWRLEP